MAKTPKLQKSIFPQSSKISTWQLDRIKVDSLEVFCTPYQLPSLIFATPRYGGRGVKQSSNFRIDDPISD